MMPVTQLSQVIESHERAVAAKLSLPHQGFVLRRSRLRGLVGRLRGGGVVSLVAGPGYGKTAFIVDLLSSADGRTVYYAVDEGDRDPLRFLGYLRAGLNSEMADRAEPRSANWSQPCSVTRAAVLDLTADLAQIMSSRAGTKTTLAIDGLHQIDASPEVVAALDLIVRALPPGWTLVLSSRRRLPLGLDEVSLGGRLVELQGRDLRLTPREVAIWAQTNWSVMLQPSEARALWRLTEGWPAALALLGQHLLTGNADVEREDVLRVIARGRGLRSYLEHRVLAGLDPLAAKIILAGSLLPRIVFPRDEGYLPGEPGQAESVLEEFVSRGFLVTRTGKRSYTLNPLLRGFAEREVWRVEGGSGLIERAASHLESMREDRQAAYLYLRAGRLDEAARILRSLAISSLNAAISFTHDQWLGLIPEQVLDGEPWLLAAKARIFQQQTDYAAAGALYDRAARLLSAEGDKEGLLPVLLGSAFCLFNQGLWDNALAVMKRCRSLVVSPEEKVEVLVAEGSILVSLCRWDEAAENWEKALALVPSTGRASLTPRIYLHRARLFYSLGQYRLGKQWAAKAAEACTESGTPARALVLNGAALLEGVTAEYELADRHATECLRLVRARGHRLVEISALLAQAIAASGVWNHRVALARIKQARELALKAGDAEELFWAEDMLGDLCRRNKNPRRAIEHHRKALQLVDDNRLAIFERVRASAAIGIDLVVLGEETEGRAALEDTVNTSRRWGLSSSLVTALFYLGWLNARSGREQEAARALTEAMRLAAEHGHVHFFAQEAQVALPILALCDRFDAGIFIREEVLPLLPRRLQTYFHELAEGSTYPTDVLLGPPRRVRLAPQSTEVMGREKLSTDTFAGMEALTDREREVLKMIALGMPNKVIAARLFITEKTVKTHANHVFRKLGVASRLQATLVFQSYQRARRTRPAGRPW